MIEETENTKDDLQECSNCEKEWEEDFLNYCPVCHKLVCDQCLDETNTKEICPLCEIDFGETISVIVLRLLRILWGNE